MFISETSNKSISIKYRGTIVAYIAATFTAIAANIVYGLFGHGVHSVYMTWMFMYPFGTGVLFYSLLYKLAPEIHKLSGYRAFYNCYNSGIAAFTAGSFLKGILDIAGTSSPYTVLFYAAGGMFILIAAVIIALSMNGNKRL